jgi:hypothetical protein
MSRIISNIIIAFVCKIFRIHWWKETVNLKLVDKKSYCRRDRCLLCGKKRLIHSSDLTIRIERAKNERTATR